MKDTMFERIMANAEVQKKNLELEQKAFEEKFEEEKKDREHRSWQIAEQFLKELEGQIFERQKKDPYSSSIKFLVGAHDQLMLEMILKQFESMVNREGLFYDRKDNISRRNPEEIGWGELYEYLVWVDIAW